MILYFRLPSFHVINSALFLHSALVPSFYINVVLIVSTEIGQPNTDLMALRRYFIHIKLWNVPTHLGYTFNKD